MPLWDNFARQAEALPLASYPTGGPHGADDFVAIHDASAGAVHRTAVRNLRSKEIFSVPLFTSTTVGPAVSTTTTPLRVIRTPYAFTVTSIVLHCLTAPGGVFAADVWVSGTSIFDGAATLTSTKLALSSGQTRSEVTTFQGASTRAIANDSELRFFVAAAQTAIRSPSVSLLGYRT